MKDEEEERLHEEKDDIKDIVPVVQGQKRRWSVSAPSYVRACFPVKFTGKKTSHSEDVSGIMWTLTILRMCFIF